MTYTMVASIVKYPYSSGMSSRKKYGFFQTEKAAYVDIAKSLGIIEEKPGSGVFVRHPLVYLVEAADDICYQVMDIEDAHKLGILDFNATRDLLFAFFADDDDSARRLKEVCASVTDRNEQIAFLRASVIGRLVELCTQIFINNHDIILAGQFEGSLIKHLEGSAAEAMRKCEATGFRLIYKHPSVVEIEIAGYKILGSLLKEFMDAVMNPDDNSYSGLLLPFIPEQYRVSFEAPIELRIRSVLDFVSGMTDVYALDLFRKINGIGLADKRFKR
jgi:dGTPase